MNSIYSKYIEYVNKLNLLSEELKSLPAGRIRYKTNRGQKEYYINGDFIPSQELNTVKIQKKQRKKISKEFSAIFKRLSKLEKSAKIIGYPLYCSCLTYRLCSNMNKLSKQYKEQCISFANAMTAIESLSISRETLFEISAWQNKEDKDFLTIFNSILKRYGYPVCNDAERSNIAEADIIYLSMVAVYACYYENFNATTLCDIHKIIFSNVCNMVECSKNIRTKLNKIMSDVKYLKRLKSDYYYLAFRYDHDIIIELVKFVAKILQIHPFQEGYKTTIIVFAILLAKHLGYNEINYELLKNDFSNIRIAIDCAMNDSSYKHLARIFCMAILDDLPSDDFFTD